MVGYRPARPVAEPANQGGENGSRGSRIPVRTGHMMSDNAIWAMKIEIAVSDRLWRWEFAYESLALLSRHLANGSHNIIRRIHSLYQN